MKPKPKPTTPEQPERLVDRLELRASCGLYSISRTLEGDDAHNNDAVLDAIAEAFWSIRMAQATARAHKHRPIDHDKRSFNPDGSFKLKTRKLL